MIYDCFTFFNELDVLEMRLNILNDYVDKFVLVEATKTFRGKDKPLYYQENKERFKNFEDKIIHVIVDSYPETDNPWFFECNQRNSIANGLTNCQDDDIILISDLDEIPRPELIEIYKNVEGIKLFEQTMTHYYINCVQNKPGVWMLGTKMLSYHDFKHLFDDKTPNYNEFVMKEMNKGTTASLIRDYKNLYHIKDGGWHFTYLGGAENLKLKFQAYSHTEVATEEYCDLKNLEKIIKEHKRFTVVALDDFFPKYILENKGKYNQYILPIEKSERFKHLFLCFIRHIFYKYNEYSGFQKRKVICILGFKIKIKWKQR